MGLWVGGGSHMATRRTAYKGRMATETRDETGHRVLLARGLHEDDEKEQTPPKNLCALNVCGHQGGEGGGGPLTWQPAPTPRSKG